MAPRETSRRQFLKIAGAAAGIAAGAPLLRSASAEPAPAAAPSSPPQAAEKRPLGKTGFTVSTVGFGAMTTRDPEVIRFAVAERGVDYVDTADCYMGGER